MGVDLLKHVADLDACLELTSPAGFYALVSGSWLGPLVTVENHPADDLQAAWDRGARPPEGCGALGLVTNGWRHLRLEEVESVAPEWHSRLLAEARNRVADGNLDVDPEDLMVESWDEVLKEMPPRRMPDYLRREVRNCVAVAVDGTSAYAYRDADAPQPTVLPLIPTEEIHQARVPDFMHFFLTGRRPE